MSTDLLSPAFIAATLERAVSSAAGGALSVLGADTMFGALDADWKAIGSVTLGTFAISILKALAAFKLTDGSGPSLTPKAEVTSNLGPLIEK